MAFQMIEVQPKLMVLLNHHIKPYFSTLEGLLLKLQDNSDALCRAWQTSGGHWMM